MKNYLSFGGGVNSVALYLLLVEQGVEFEPLFVHHGTDWPDTYHYVAGFQWWCKNNGYPSIKILRPDVGTVEKVRFQRLYDYYNFKKIFPCRSNGSCTDRFKIVTLERYQKKPCWVYIGYAADESHRAVITSKPGIEYRWPLIEQEIDRQGCIDIIRKHGLPIPMKSGCYICPYQKKSQWKELRTRYPELFCAAKTLEQQYADRRKAEGKKPIWINKEPLQDVVDDRQSKIWHDDEYPPCLCGL